jgi:predicted transcriptional regulator
VEQISLETRKRMSESAKNRCTDEWRRKKSEQYSTKLDLEIVKSMYQNGMSQHEIANELGVSQKVIWRFMKNNDIKARVAAKRDQTGDKNHMWNGGKTINEAGYIMVRIPDHPRSEANNGYVFEHILVAEENTGRHLIFYAMGDSRNEVVHHKNENKKDNSPENLEVMTHREHMELHNQLRKGSGSNAKRKHNESA